MGKKSSGKGYYVVWCGREPGIYTTWAECEAQVKGAKGARYKKFPSQAEAQQAFEAGVPAPQPRVMRKAEPPHNEGGEALLPNNFPRALAVDAACSGNPGMMEYRGVWMPSGKVEFHIGPMFGTNNIGEFLAIVHALALIKREGWNDTAVYSDSRNALLWIKARKCRTKLVRCQRSEKVYEMIARAETWLSANDFSNIPLLKWQTKILGEIPADFGRK